MAPAKKQELDALVWKWTETVSPENVDDKHVAMAYRLHLDICSPGECRRNCKGNPKCYNGLGENKWMQDFPEEEWYILEDPNEKRKDSGNLTGLKNLGATCYLNTFLQVWFHNPDVRRAVFLWREEDGAQQLDSLDDMLATSTEEEIEEQITPRSVIGHLQAVFALLQFSGQRFVDPTPFINSLGLDTSLQQDAQEFCKLFLNLIEDTLSQKSGSYVNFIHEHLMGQYTYVTKCCHCNLESARPSTFYELDLNVKGHTKLEECITDFLQVEKLEGDNQYYCSGCGCKRNAVRSIHLKILPPVLNLQLLRFVFDRQSGLKKKLNTRIHFPEVLDMTPFLCSEQEVLYDLKAVLLHNGPSAYSGHYVANIQNQFVGEWFQFNDENVERIDTGKTLILAKEDEGESKAPKCTKGVHASSNTYMLVYKRRTQPDGSVATSSESHESMYSVSSEYSSQGSYSSYDDDECLFTALPVVVQRFVEFHNYCFEKWVKEITEKRQENATRGKARQEIAQNVWQSLPFHEDENFHWISTEWLKEWFSSLQPESLAVPDYKQLLCSHDKLDPDNVPLVKCISDESVQLIMSPLDKEVKTLTRSSLCFDCVRNKCANLRCSAKILDDNEFLTALLKKNTVIENGPSFWIGKNSLRSWKKIALEQTQKNGNSTGTDQDVSFNSEVLCSGGHNKLTIDTSQCRLINMEAWNRLKSYFPSAPEFSNTEELCSLCQTKQEEELEIDEIKKIQATEQKNCLLSLFANRTPCTLEENTPYHIVCEEFLDMWRRFIKHPLKHEYPTQVCNSCLICPHGGLLYHPQNYQDDFERFSVLSESEWTALRQFYACDVEISLIKLREGTCTTLETAPDYCPECQLLLQQERLNVLLTYKDVLVYVRKLTSDNGSYQEVPAELLEKLGCHVNNGPEEENDEEQPCKKKSKIQEGFDGIRRSNRHRKVRGEREIKVSSTDTLKDLKVKVMSAFSVLPFDQHLIYNGELLTNNDQTLADLHIYPSSVIYLKCDEPSEDPNFIDDYTKVHEAEEGFKGTGLLKC